MVEQEFKLGDYLYLMDNSGMSAKKGSIGRVIPMNESSIEYFKSISKEGISVEWLPQISQQNGGYLKSKFRLATFEEIPTEHRKLTNLIESFSLF